MDLFKQEYQNEKKDYDALSFKSQRRNLRVLPQVGTTTPSEDAKRKALLPGKRISKTGNVYFETRRNRTDAKGSTI